MIPKVIHYCWFGNNPLPMQFKLYIDTWKKYCPEYKIIEWNETNFDLRCNKYVQQASELKKWAFVSDYARLKVIYEEGGIYLDTDVELLKSLDSLLMNKAFMGLEPPDYGIATGLGFGAEKGSSILKELMSIYDSMNFINNDGTLNTQTCVKITTNYFMKKGFHTCNEIQIVDDVTLYPTEYFCPMNWLDGSINITKNTFSIHHYDYSWASEDERKIMLVKRKIMNYFPKEIGKILAKIYGRLYRIYIKLFKNKGK